MSNIFYEFEGKTIGLSPEEIRPFNMNEPDHCVKFDTFGAFTLKNGKKISGKMIGVEYIYPKDFSDFPLKCKFLIETENETLVELKFTEIESYEE